MVEIILEKLKERNYQRPIDINGIIENRDILFEIISELVDEKAKTDEH